MTLEEKYQKLKILFKNNLKQKENLEINYQQLLK